MAPPHLKELRLKNRKQSKTIYLHPEVIAYFEANRPLGMTVNQLIAHLLTVIANEGIIEKVLESQDEEG